MRRRPVSPASPAIAVLAALILSVLALMTTTRPSVAQDLPRLDDAVTDEAGLLSGREDEVREALAGSRDRVQLFVLTIDTTGQRPVTAFAEEVAAANSLGGDDALLVIAIDDRTFALWVADGVEDVSDDEVATISRDVVEPRLADGAFTDAAIDAARALADATTTGDGRSAPWLLPLVLLLPVAAFGGLALVGTVRERRGRRRTAEERDRRIGELARRTNARLIASDEAVREAATELDFAEAQFHPEDVVPFATALSEAREELHAAFAIRQRLDDDEPDTVEQREAMLKQIDGHTTRIDELLTAEHSRLDELRRLEREAPEQLEALQERITALVSRRNAAEDDHARVVDASPTVREAVGGNLVEVDKHLEGADAAVSEGLTAAREGASSAAARALREAQLALASADRLVIAVERATTGFDEATRGVDDAIASAEAALTSAGAALADTPRAAVPADDTTQDSPRELHAQARERLTQARARRDEDVVRAHELATGSASDANRVLAMVEEARDRRERVRTAAHSAVKAAAAVLARAEDYVETRRRGIGRDARTRLQEAERHLTRARASVDDDPDGATRHAKLAERLANEAYRLARRDFHDYDTMRGPFGRGPYGGRGGGTVIIGGFPIPMGGNRRGGGGFGGTTWGSPSTTRRSRRVGVGGGFGGGRSAGGGFGGGRSRGGRF